MVLAPWQPFSPPATPWQEAQALPAVIDLGSGLDQALQKLAWWNRCRALLGHLGVDVDLVVAGSADAERLSQSRWPVLAALEILRLRCARAIDAAA